MIRNILYLPKTKKILSSVLGHSLYVKLAPLLNLQSYIVLKRLLFDLGILNPSKSLPAGVAIEINAFCNRRCIYCPNYEYDQRSDVNSVMSEDLFCKVVDELAKLNYCRTIYYHLYNEPLTDKRLPQFVKYTRHKLPETTIDIYTNGDYLNYEMYRHLIKEGVDRFLITIHGKKPSTQLSGTLNKLSEKEKRTNIIIKKSYEDYINKEDVFFNRGGSIRINERLPDSKPCEYVLACNIDYRGNVILCCNDYFGKHIFGNIKKQSLRAIWFDKKYMILRNRIALGYRDLSICRKCNI